MTYAGITGSREGFMGIDTGREAKLKGHQLKVRERWERGELIEG